MKIAVRMIETATFEQTYDLPTFAALVGVEPTEEAVQALLADESRLSSVYGVKGSYALLDSTVDGDLTVSDREWTIVPAQEEPAAMTTPEPLPSWVGDRPLRLCTAADTRESHLALIPLLEAHGWTVNDVPSGGKKAIPPGWTDDDQAALDAAHRHTGVGSRFD